MEVKYEILLLLIISTCLEISNCMVIPESQDSGSIKLEETDIKPLGTDFLNITMNDPTTTSDSHPSTEVLEPVLGASENESDTSSLTESTATVLNEVTTVKAEDRLFNVIEETSNSSLMFQHITDSIIKPEQYYSKKVSNQNQYEKEEIVRPPPTINYEEQVKNIIKEKGSLSDIPDLEIRKTIMTELLDVDYPQNIRPDHSANTMKNTKEVVTEQAQTTKPNDDSSVIPPVTDSKYNETSFEKTESTSPRLNENEDKSELTLTKSFTDKNTNDISNIDDKLKINLGLKKKSRQLNFLNLETNSVSGKTESNEATTEDNHIKNTTEQEVQDKEDDLFFHDVLEPSKTQKSVFYLKIDTNAPFEIMDRERLVRWMDRQSKSMETNATKNSDYIETTEKTKIVESGDSLKTFGQNDEVQSENQKEINSSTIVVAEQSSTNEQSSDSRSSVRGSDIVSMPDMSVDYAGEPEIEVQQSGAGIESAKISETLIEMNTELGMLEVILPIDNATDNNSEDAFSGLSPALINETKTIQNINLFDSVTEKKETTLEHQDDIETTTQILNELKNEHIETNDTADTPDIVESVQEKKTKQIKNLDLLKSSSSEESSSESKEDKIDNKTETSKKDSSEENSSESKEKVDKVKKPKDDSSEEDSKESKETTSKKNKIENTDINESNKKNEKDDGELNVTDSLINIAGTTAIIDIRIGSGNEDTDENKATESASSESSESMESSIPKGRSLDLSAIAAKNNLKETSPNHDVYRKSVGEYSDEKNNSQPTPDFSSGLQPNPSLKVLLPLFQEKIVPVISFETTTLLPLKVLPKQEKHPQMSEIPVDADVLNEILSSDDAIASASVGKESRHIENDNNSLLSYLLSTTVVVMVIGILMGTFYKYRGKQGTLNIELEERKNGKNEENSNDDLQEISISTPSSSDNNSCQSNSLLATSPSIISSENGSQIKINENNVSTIIVSQ